jgi:23S rRNA pseudouridine2605 synthase
VTEARDMTAPESGELRQPPPAVGEAAAVAEVPAPEAAAAEAANDAGVASTTQLRISKFLMQCGLGSRRHVEEMIAAGRVNSDGVAVDAPGFKIEPASAAITVDGKRVQPLPEGSALGGSQSSAAASAAGAPKSGRKAAPAAALVIESLRGNHVLTAGAARGGDDAGRLVRIAKYMARCGVASRRQAEEMITAGRVTLNGATVLEPGTKLEPGSDSVKLDGKSVVGARTRPQLFLVHKLKGEIISASGVDASGEGSAAGRGGAAAARGDDAQRRRSGDRRLQERLTLLDRAGLMGLPERLIPVGGLDFSSTGLQLLTTDPALARVLEHEVNAGLFKRTYEVRVYGRHLGRAIRALRNGGRIEGIGRLSPSDVELLSERQKGAKADAPAAAAGDEGARGGSAARRSGAGAGVVSDAESEDEEEGEDGRGSVPPADAVPYTDGQGDDGKEGAHDGGDGEDEDLPPRIALLRITMAEGNVSAA